MSDVKASQFDDKLSVKSAGKSRDRKKHSHHNTNTVSMSKRDRMLQYSNRVSQNQSSIEEDASYENGPIGKPRSDYRMKLRPGFSKNNTIMTNGSAEASENASSENSISKDGKGSYRR